MIELLSASQTSSSPPTAPLCPRPSPTKAVLGSKASGNHFTRKWTNVLLRESLLFCLFVHLLSTVDIYYLMAVWDNIYSIFFRNLYRKWALPLSWLTLRFQSGGETALAGAAMIWLKPRDGVRESGTGQWERIFLKKKSKVDGDPRLAKGRAVIIVPQIRNHLFSYLIKISTSLG